MCLLPCVTCHISLFMCHMSRVPCHLSCVMCHMSPATCHLSPTPSRATASDPPTANSPILHSMLVCRERTKKYKYIMHGHEICFMFWQNNWGRSSEECLFTHQTTKNASTSPTSSILEQQVFWEGPNSQPFSPRVGMATMSEHLQNRQWVIKTLPVNIVEMIPQIVSQVLLEY